MQPYTNLKEIGQAYINENITRHLQSVDAVATTSPSPPHPTLARCSQDHNQNLSPKIISLIPLICLYSFFSMEIPHYIGFGGLTTMERITHQIH
jgi:hypothetical protein